MELQTIKKSHNNVTYDVLEEADLEEDQGRNGAQIDVETDTVDVVNLNEDVPNHDSRISPFIWTKTTIQQKLLHIWTISPVARSLPSIVLMLIVWFSPPPDGLTPTAMHLFGVFLAVILSFITNPYPMSVTVLLALAFLTLTKNFQCVTKSGEKIECAYCQTAGPSGSLYECNAYHDALIVALTGFANSTVWLVFAAYQIGRAVEVTGFGRRLSLLLVKYFGRSLIGLGYAVCFSEMILGPVVPSNTARGAIVNAVVMSICRTLGSTPEKNTVSGGGQYLILVGGHANLIAASMYQTGMAANPLVSAKAADIFGIEWGFSQWLAGSSVPAISAFLLLPITMRFLSRASVDITAVRENIKLELQSLGRTSQREYILMATLFGCLMLWVTSFATHLDSTLVAIMGVVVLLLTDTLTWDDMLKNVDAWDIMIWLGGLIVMADQLTALGLASWIGQTVSEALESLGTIEATLVVAIIYFYSMYMFCSLTGHIVAFGGPFLEAGRDLNLPPYLLVALISYFSTLCGCLTNYSSGPIIIYFSQKYVSTRRWFSYGFLMSISHIVVWFSVGMLWWKILGYY